jgi:hypothetical protein
VLEVTFVSGVKIVEKDEAYDNDRDWNDSGNRDGGSLGDWVDDSTDPGPIDSKSSSNLNN